MAATKIEIEATVNASLEKVWDYWTKPEYIVQWNHASDDWHCPFAENNLFVNGTFKATMASKDGKTSFDFEGVYIAVRINEYIHYKIADGRSVEVFFKPISDGIKVVEIFEAESVHPAELQKSGWQSILNNFKKLVENN